jgi:predicted aminopeptidase
MKKFGEMNGLKATPNYREFVQLHRSAAVYVVSASEPLRFEAKTWHFPIVGSFPYLGWFDLDRAKTYATDLREKEGWDVDVRGASAYSTLGWFRDAVLSTMIPEGDEAIGELANVILHESVHATLYVKGQSYFDESIASFIADRLTPEYLRQSRGASSKELEAYLKSEEIGRERAKILHEAYLELDRLYGSELGKEEKLAKKTEIYARLKADLGIKRDINNATLIQYKTYNTGQTQFEELFAACQKDWKRFLSSLQTLRPESFKGTQQENLSTVLKPLVERKCQTAFAG